jgi:DNA polymerase I
MKLLSAAAVRRCLVADPGHVIFSADFDQMELRVAAALAGEQSMIDAAKRGESLHKIVAAKLFGEAYNPDQYRYAKSTDLGWLFGGGPRTLSEQAGISFGKAYGIIQEFEQLFPALTAYKRNRVRSLLKSALTTNEYRLYQSLRSRMYVYDTNTAEGRSARRAIQIEIDRLLYRKIGYVTTPFGRRLVVDAAKAYTIVNYEVQSSAADLMKHALLDAMADEELEPAILLPVHDELLGQAPVDDAEYLAEKLAQVMGREFLGVPITANGTVYGKSWGHGYANKEATV